MVGAQDMVRVDLLTPALDFLEIPQQKWTGIIESTVRASVEELAYMSRVRFSRTATLILMTRNFDALLMRIF